MCVALEINAQEPPEIVESVQTEKSINTLFWLGLILFGGFLLAGKHVYTQIWRKHSIPAKDAQQLREMRRRLLHALVELDEKYESGQLDKQRYVSERARCKQELVELTLLCRNFER